MKCARRNHDTSFGRKYSMGRMTNGRGEMHVKIGYDCLVQNTISQSTLKLEVALDSSI